jgi:hypothetical protein
MLVLLIKSLHKIVIVSLETQDMWMNITYFIIAHPEDFPASPIVSIADRRILGADSGAKSVLSAL